jgi:hypothetical protein
MEYAGRAALLGIAFKFRELTGAERDKFEVGVFNDEMEIVDGKPVTRRKLNQVHLRARLVALCLVGQDGKRLFGEDEVEQLSDGIPTAVLSQLFTAAQKLNKLDGTAEAEAEKNSAADQPAASISG